MDIIKKELNDNLVDLGIARCNLKSLPSYLSKFERLRYLDARDNKIVNVDDDVSVKGHGMMEQSARSSRPKESRKENDNGIKKLLEMDGGRIYDY